MVRHDRLVGAVLIGDNAEFAAFRRLIETGSELDEQREQLLRPAAAGLPGAPRGRLVCSCHGVGADDLRAAVAAGSATLAELCAATRAGRLRHLPPGGGRVPGTVRRHAAAADGAVRRRARCDGEATRGGSGMNGRVDLRVACPGAPAGSSAPGRCVRSRNCPAPGASTG